MRKLRYILAAATFWCVGANVSAQQFGEEEKFALRGRVVNAVTGEGVGGALVELYSGARKAQFSAADGTFEFAELQRGNYMLATRKPGYFNERDLGKEYPGIGSGSQAVPSESDAVIKLTPEGVIYGRVEDEKGRAVEGMGVQAEMWVVSNGMKQLQLGPGGMVQTDDEGNFRIAQLPPGDYYVKFSETGGGGTVYRDTERRPRTGRAGEAKEGQQGYGIQYYPGVAEAAMAGVIRVRAGATVPIRQTLERLRLYEILGVVRGAPAGGAFNISLLQGGSGAGWPHGKSQIYPNTGEFRMEGVPAGKYLLTANATDPGAQGFTRRQGQLAAQTVIDVNADIAGLTLFLGRGATIGVRVQEEANAGDAGHQVRVNLQSAEFPELSQQLMAPPPSNDARALRAFENVAAGTYSVEVWPEGWGYVASLRCAGTDLLKEDLKVGAGTSVPPIEVRLRNDGAELTVSAVENGKPVVGRVIVYSEEYPKLSTAAVTSPSGVSPLRNVPPGTYKLVATRGMRELEFRNPATMATYLTRATTVTLAPEAKVNVQVEVQNEEPEQ
jgi:hypothetical protein